GFEAVGDLEAIDDARLLSGGVKHAVEERREQAVGDAWQLRAIAAGLALRKRIAEREKDDDVVAEAGSKGVHHLASAAADVARVIVPAFVRMGAVAEVPERRVVMPDVE